MGITYTEAKAAVLARNDPHMKTCEYCAPYVEELIKAEMENRRDELLNRMSNVKITAIAVGHDEFDGEDLYPYWMFYRPVDASKEG